MLLYYYFGGEFLFGVLAGKQNEYGGGLKYIIFLHIFFLAKKNLKKKEIRSTKMTVLIYQKKT